ncbi:MAG: exo-alpha-sialidase [Gammaproteobacteria bacterium]|nr:exo-alpha-sialidase [Gammaproteobacteria bacterium]
MAPTSTGSQLPHLSQHPGGGVIMSWVEPDGEGHRLRFAHYANGAWSTAQTVARGENWFVNWADFPSVEALGKNLWAAHWLVRSGWQTYAYDVAVSLSIDEGRTWSDPIKPHDDNTPTEHGFVSLFPQGQTVGLVWLDGRKTIASAAGDVAPHDIGMTLRSATLDPQGKITGEFQIDDLVCDCCQTDVSLSARGPVVVYRDRSAEEIRDISVAVYGDGGWSEAKTVSDDNWQVFGCPVNGPAIDSSGDVIAVAWHTQADNQPRVRFARLLAGSDEFDTPIDIDGASAMGRVDVLVDENGEARVSWLRRGDDNMAELCVRSVDPTGKLGGVRVIAEIAATRPSGFPQMMRDGNQILLAWTEVVDGEFRITTDTIPWSIPVR